MIKATTRACAIAGVLTLTLAAAPTAPTSAIAHAAKAPSTKKKSPPAPPTLSGTVAPNGSVILKNSRGVPVTHLTPGWYTVSIAVETRKADFHVVGPDTNKATAKKFEGDVLWGVHFVKGTYRYMSDSNVRGTTHTVKVS